MSIAVAQTPYSEREFSIGRMISDTFRAFFRHFWAVWLIGLAFLILIIAVIVGPVVLFIGVDRLAAGTPPNPQDFLLPGLVIFPLALAVGLLGFAVIMAGTVSGMATGRFGAGRAFGLALRRLLPMIVAMILLMIITLLPFALLALPVTYWATIPVAVVIWMYLSLRFMMVMAATVMERKGPISSFGRSAELVGGRYWSLLGALLVITVIFIAIRLLLMGLTYVLAANGMLTGMIVMNILEILVAPALSGFWSVAFGAIYYGLRIEKDGPADEELNQVFA